MWMKRTHRCEHTVVGKLERRLGSTSNRAGAAEQYLGSVGDLAGDKGGNPHMTGWSHRVHF